MHDCVVYRILNSDSATSDVSCVNFHSFEPAAEDGVVKSTFRSVSARERSVTPAAVKQRTGRASVCSNDDSDRDDNDYDDPWSQRGTSPGT